MLYMTSADDNLIIIKYISLIFYQCENFDLGNKLKENVQFIFPLELFNLYFKCLQFSKTYVSWSDSYCFSFS